MCGYYSMFVLPSPPLFFDDVSFLNGTFATITISTEARKLKLHGGFNKSIIFFKSTFADYAIVFLNQSRVAGMS